MSLVKSSFTLIETIISIILLSIIVSSFFKILSINSNNNEDFTYSNKTVFLSVYKNDIKEKLLVNIEEKRTSSIYLKKYSLK